MSFITAQAKLYEVRRTAARAIQARFPSDDENYAWCVLDAWAEDDNLVVLHVNSGGNAIEVCNALRRTRAYKHVASFSHPEYGVLIAVD